MGFLMGLCGILNQPLPVVSRRRDNSSENKLIQSFDLEMRRKLDIIFQLKVINTWRTQPSFCT